MKIGDKFKVRNGLKYKYYAINGFDGSLFRAQLFFKDSDNKVIYHKKNIKVQGNILKNAIVINNFPWEVLI